MWSPIVIFDDVLIFGTSTEKLDSSLPKKFIVSLYRR